MQMLGQLRRSLQILTYKFSKILKLTFEITSFLDKNTNKWQKFDSIIWI